MYPPVFRTLSSNSGVTDIIGTRVFPAGSAPQNVVAPYAVHQLITGSPENYLGDLPDIDSYTVQLDVYAQAVSSAEAAAKALRDAIEPVAHVVRWGGETKDAESGLYRYSFDVTWHVKR